MYRGMGTAESGIGGMCDQEYTRTCTLGMISEGILFSAAWQLCMLLTLSLLLTISIFSSEYTLGITVWIVSTLLSFAFCLGQRIFKKKTAVSPHTRPSFSRSIMLCLILLTATLHCLVSMGAASTGELHIIMSLCTNTALNTLTIRSLLFAYIHHLCDWNILLSKPVLPIASIHCSIADAI